MYEVIFSHCPSSVFNPSNGIYTRIVAASNNFYLSAISSAYKSLGYSVDKIWHNLSEGNVNRDNAYFIYTVKMLNVDALFVCAIRWMK